MADAPNTVATLNGLFKEVYADGIAMLVPDGVKVQKNIKFIEKQKEIGNQYHQPVLLSYEHGFTFAGASAGAFTLNDTIASVMKDAAITGSQIVLRAQMDYESAARAAKGRNAFIDATSLMFESMQKSMRKRVEVELLYGGSGLGTVASVSSNTATVTTAEFAPGIWAGMEGAKVEIFSAALTTNRGSATIVSIDMDARTVTVDSMPGGVIGTDVIFYYGAQLATPASNELTGIHKIMTNSGSLFGISASSYTLWKSASYSAGSAALSQAKVGSAIAAAVSKGLDEDLLLLVNPKSWNNLLNDQAALRRYADPKGKMGFENGSQSIEFYNQNGAIKIEPSIYVKEGYAYGLVTELWKRPGAADVTFKTPGYGDQIFFHIPTKAGFEVRAYTDQAIFCEAPGKNFIITGIVNA